MRAHAHTHAQLMMALQIKHWPHFFIHNSQTKQTNSLKVNAKDNQTTKSRSNEYSRKPTQPTTSIKSTCIRYFILFTCFLHTHTHHLRSFKFIHKIRRIYLSFLEIAWIKAKRKFHSSKSYINLQNAIAFCAHTRVCRRKCFKRKISVFIQRQNVVLIFVNKIEKLKQIKCILILYSNFIHYTLFSKWNETRSILFILPSRPNLVRRSLELKVRCSNKIFWSAFKIIDNLICNYFSIGTNVYIRK